MSTAPPATCRPAINAARAQLPANMPSNPTYRKINPADSPILILALTSDTATVAQMYDASDSILAQKIAQVDGVGQTFTGGSAKPAVRIEANPYMLSHFGLSMDDLRAALGTVNVLKPTGYLNGDGPDSQRVRIASTDQLYGADAYGPIIIATNKGPRLQRYRCLRPARCVSLCRHQQHRLQNLRHRSSG